MIVQKYKGVSINLDPESNSNFTAKIDNLYIEKASLIEIKEAINLELSKLIPCSLTVAKIKPWQVALREEKVIITKRNKITYFTTNVTKNEFNEDEEYNSSLFDNATYIVVNEKTAPILKEAYRLYDEYNNLVNKIKDNLKELQDSEFRLDRVNF